MFSGSTSYDASHISYVAAGVTRTRGKSPNGAACVGQGSILADPARLSNVIDILQRYPNCFLQAPPSRDILTSIFLHIFRISLVSRFFWFSWQNSPSFYHFEIYFALGCRWHATTVTFSLKDFYARYFIAAGLGYAQIIHRRLSYERAKIWEILRRIEHRRCKRRITLLFILRTWAHELRGFKSLLAFSFRLDRTKHEREINYTCLYIVSKYGLLHPSE